MTDSPTQQADEAGVPHPKDSEASHSPPVLWTQPPQRVESAAWAPFASAYSRSLQEEIGDGRD
eukprot:8869623-Pyramimonas_sp.AAC.1